MNGQNVGRRRRVALGPQPALGDGNMKMGKQERRWALLTSTVFAVGACDSMVGVNDPERDDVFGSGIVVTEVRAVAGFTGVRVSGGHTVVVEQAEVEGAEVTTDDNLVAFVRTDIIGGTLVVSIDPQVRLRPTEPLIVRIHARELSTLIASGAVSLDADIGSVPELNVQVSGVSLVWVTGSAEWLHLQISGVTAYHGFGVESDSALVTASGVNLAELWVHDRLEVDGSGVSTVRYRGDPSVIARLGGASTVVPVP